MQNGRILVLHVQNVPLHFNRGSGSVEFMVGREGVGGILPRNDSASFSHT